MNLKAAGAIWMPKVKPLEQHSDDAYRITTSINDEVVTVLSVGFLSLPGMSGVGFNEASRSAVSCIAAYLAQTSGNSSQRLKDAIILAESEMAMLNQDPDVFAVKHSSTLICALLKDYQAFISWIGSDQAYLIRNESIVSQTEGHLMFNEDPDAWQIFFSEWKYNPSRSIGSSDIKNAQYRLGILNEPWILAPGDYIVFATNMLLEITKEEDIPKLISGKSSKEAAEKLVEVARTQDRERQLGVGAIVICVI